MKDTLGVSRALDLKREREALGFLIAIRRYESPPISTWSPTVRLPCMTLSDQSAGT